jgi:Toprim domain/Zinc-binding domain of primase-helicase
MIPADDIEHARAVPLEQEIARRGIKLKRAGAELIGPCPVCGGRDRFAVHIKKQCWNVAVAPRAVTSSSSLNTSTASPSRGQSKRSPATPPGRCLKLTAPVRHDDDDDQRRLEQADAIWRASSPLMRDAINYFAQRRINIGDAPEHGGLRFHVRCPWRGGTAPAIVGRFTTALSNEPRGIWRRPISGEKPKTLGPMAGCVIRLWPDEAVEQGLVLGEGVETVLRAATRIRHKGTLLQPAWAACSAGNLERFPVLSGIEALTILVDHDASGAGQKAAAECAARWSAARREVTRLTPKILGADFNDVVIA